MWRNRITGKARSLGSDLEAAQVAARELNHVVELQMRLEDAKQVSLPTVGDVIDLFIDAELDRQPWAASTKKINVAALKRYKREFGGRVFVKCDRIFIGGWLSDLNTTADSYNGHRYLLSVVWKFGISRGFAEINEPELTLKRSMAKNIAANLRVRKRLELPEFWAVHKNAPPFLQLAMELSLLTLQARAEVINMQFTDIRDGHLFVIRKKTASKTDFAFIALPVTESINALIRRARTTGTVCPYLVHTVPKRINRKNMANRAHPFCVTDGHITKTFKKAAREAGVFEHLRPAEWPVFHEIRSLGGRLMKANGYSTKQIGGFYGHSKERTSQIYLDNPDKLTDADFLRADGGLSILELQG